MRCSCLPTYTPGTPTPTTPICPPECLQAGSVIKTMEEGLDCNDTLIVNLTEITDPGSCENITFSVYSVSNPGTATLSASIVGSTLTITNDATQGIVGEYVTVEFLMDCEDDIRSVVGFVQVYVNESCVV